MSRGALVVALLLVGVGIGWAVLWRDGAESGGGVAKPSAAKKSEGVVRLVSFSPALTRIVVDLGRESWLVGVGEHDAAAPAGTAVLGNYLAPDMEKLVTAAPTLVLVMAGKEGAHQRLKELADRQGYELAVFSTPHDVAGVLDLIHREDEQADVGKVLGAPAAAAEMAERIRLRLAALAQVTAQTSMRKVLIVFNANPLWISGPGSVEDDLLRFLGARNATGAEGGAAMKVDREKLLGMAPDAVVMLIPGMAGAIPGTLPGGGKYPPAEPGAGDGVDGQVSGALPGAKLGGVAEDARLAIFRGLDIPVVREGRFSLIDDPACLLVQSSAIEQVAGLLAERIHPERAEEIRRVMKAAMAELRKMAGGPAAATTGGEEEGQRRGSSGE
ncbi:MAG: ABC transporter substrate-binding protein [Phycisphaeraceae bacterium]|nr:ABC transporter substrate-binding protein [Phycisphaeraceae bacterium]